MKEQKLPDEDRLPDFVPSKSQNKLDCATHLQKQTQSQKQTEMESEAKTEYDEFSRFSSWFYALEPELKSSSRFYLLQGHSMLKKYASCFDVPMIVTANHSPKRG